MREWKYAWTYFSVLAAGLEERIDGSTLNRWEETGIFAGSPFGEEDRYIRQGIRQIRYWLEDYREEPRILERLRQDYLALFIGTPKPLAPFWGSYYLEKEGLLFQDITAKAGEWYGRYGLAVHGEKGLPEDSLLYELMFITVILEAWQNAARSKDLEKAKEQEKNLGDFVREQMMPWITPWREDVMLYGRTEYYRGLCNMIYGGLAYLLREESKAGESSRSVLAAGQAPQRNVCQNQDICGGGRT